MKILKKALIIIPVTLLTIFLLLLAAPIMFKGKILEIAKRELNRMLAAEVDFSDLKLSFIRSFPDAYVALENLSVTGTGEFEGEILVAFKSLSVTVDIKSVIKMDNIRVKSILLDRADVRAHISKDGSANWDIIKPAGKAEVSSERVSAEEVPPKEASALKIALNKFEIRDADLSFKDDSSKITALANGLNFFLQGDMTLDNVDLNLKLNIDDADFLMNGVRLLNNARVGFVSDVAADFKNMAFTLKENRFDLNEIVLKFDGSARIPGDVIIDMKFATERTDFKSVLGLVPAVYMKNFELITTAGSFALSGDVKGVYNGKQMPSAAVNLIIDNGMFKYPDLPKSVNNVNIKANAFYDGAVFDKSTLYVEKLHFEMAGNPFDAELHVKSPKSDMQVAAKFFGKIDFNSLLDVIPLDDIAVKGLLECDFALAGRMSTLEKKRYENFDARGMLKLSGIDFNGAAFPQAVKIANTQLNLTPRKVDLVNFNAVIGKSDISVNGAFENFIPFVFKDETVRGSLSLKSNTIDLNEIMASKGSGDKSERDDEPLSVIEVPKNIDFTVMVNIGNLFFDKLDITGVKGTVSAKDGRLLMQNLDMNLLEGNITLSGEYNTQDIKVPSINFNASIRQFGITSALSSFTTLEKIMPNPQNYAGKVSANLSLHSILDEHLSPVLTTMASNGLLQPQNLKIQNSQLFGTMADMLKNESLRIPSLNNFNIKYEIKDGWLAIEPVRMSIAQTSLELSGRQGLDMTLDYKVNASVPVSAIGSGASDILKKIPGGSSVREIKITGLIGGTVTKPVVSLGIADMASNVVETVKETVKEKVEDVKQQVKDEVDKQITAIMAEAERQAANIRNTAKQTADRIRREADAAADKLESNAKTPIEKLAAKVAAGKLRDEGNASAAKLEQEAERQIAAIMDNATKRADSLRNN